MQCEKCKSKVVCPYCAAPYRTNFNVFTGDSKRKSLFVRIKERLIKMNWKNFFDGLIEYSWHFFGIIVLFLGIGAGVYCIYRSAIADGKIDYCTVDNISHSSSIYLYGHRAWRSDVMMANCSSAEECKNIAVKLGCPFGIK